LATSRRGSTRSRAAKGTEIVPVYDRSELIYRALDITGIAWLATVIAALTS
jgi:hypothetical protein